MSNNFFVPLENRSPYFKMAAEGVAGSGKTYTLALIAIGLYQKIKSKKPVVIFDTEKSAKFLKPLFREHGINVETKESRTLTDLAATIKICNDGYSDVLLIDSITHVWEQFLEDYKIKKSRKRLQFQDWGEIKPTWKRTFSDAFVTMECNALFTGREGFTYDYEEINGKKELIKTGVKMKAETETAYEPDVLIRMERFEELLGKDVKVWRTATVIKDRSNIIDGQVFKNPTFKVFEPVLDFLFSEVKEKVNTVSHPNSDLIEEEASSSADRDDRRIMLERNSALLDRIAAGTSKDSRALRLFLLEYAYYGETSDLAISRMTKGQLDEANSRLQEVVALLLDIQRKERMVYPVEKAIISARNKYLGTESLGSASVDQLKEYNIHLTDRESSDPAMIEIRAKCDSIKALIKSKALSDQLRDRCEAFIDKPSSLDVGLALEEALKTLPEKPKATA